MKNYTLLAFYVLAGAVIIVCLDGLFGRIPATGDLLDPAHGLYYNARYAESEPDITANIPGLKGDVSILRDERSVPHIFAADDLDAIAALG